MLRREFLKLSFLTVLLYLTIPRLLLKRRKLTLEEQKRLLAEELAREYERDLWYGSKMTTREFEKNLSYLSRYGKEIGTYRTSEGIINFIRHSRL